MAETQSLRAEILERLNLKKGGKKTASSNIGRATKDFAKSNAPQFQGKSQKKRHEMAVAAGLSAARGESVLRVGDKALYEHKEVKIQMINESGMALVKFVNRRDPIIVRIVDLEPSKTELTEGFIGMASIGPTYREPSNYGFMKIDLNPEDIGLLNLREDEDAETDDVDTDDGGESTDNGSNVHHDGHSGKTEIDTLPTPSDTIATAYDDKKGPKEVGTPLSIEPGAQENLLWQAPDWDGYDYPADSPEIPTADFEGDDGGNARAPHWNSSEHQPGDGQDDEEDEDRTDEALHPAMVAHQFKKKGETATEESDEDVAEGSVTDPARKDSHKNLAKMRKDIDVDEQFSFDTKPTLEGVLANFKRLVEMDDEDNSSHDSEGDMLDKPDHEPGKDAKITLSLPAMAAVLVTCCNQQPGENTLKAMVEALAELSKGKTIEMNDLDDVAAHMNGEECGEMENRNAGAPDHEGMGSHHEVMVSLDDGGSDAETWPGDMDKTKSGKNKLLDCGSPSAMEENYNSYDAMEGTEMTEAEVLTMVKRRAGLPYLPGMRRTSRYI